MFLIVLVLECGMPSIAMFMQYDFDAEGSSEDLIDAPAHWLAEESAELWKKEEREQRRLRKRG